MSNVCSCSITSEIVPAAEALAIILFLRAAIGRLGSQSQSGNTVRQIAAYPCLSFSATSGTCPASWTPICGPHSIKQLEKSWIDVTGVLKTFL